MPRRSILSATGAVAFALFVAGSVVGPIETQAGGGCHGPDGSGYTEGSATVVRMDVCSFSPTVIRVPVGTTVRFLNTARNEHAVAGRSQTWGSDILTPGAETSERFEAAGVYPYACPLHPGMIGAVIVGEATAAGSGNATLADIAGTASETATADTTTARNDAMPSTAGVVVGLIAGALVGALATGSVIRRRRPAPTPTGPEAALPMHDG